MSCSVFTAMTCHAQLAEWIVRKEIFPLDDDAREDGEQRPAIRHVFNHFVRVRPIGRTQDTQHIHSLW